MPLGNVIDRLDIFLRSKTSEGPSVITRRTIVLGSVVVVVFVGCLTLIMYFLQLQVLVIYGLFLLILYSANALVFGLMKRNMEWFGIMAQALLILSSFICILFLGGIATSIGIVFVGLAAVVFSVVFQKVRITLSLAVLYSMTIIAAGILQPFLQIPDELTPQINHLFFTVNAVWISGYIFLFVVNYIRARIREEEAEMARLKELDETRTRLFTYISHECRTPLTIILGTAEQLKNRPDRQDSEKHEMIIRNGRQVLKQINQMLDLSRIEAGSMPVHLVQGNIVDFMRVMIESFQSLALPKGINLTFSADTDRMIMDFDRDKLGAIISNLISNAVKFTSPGGDIAVQSFTQQDRSGEEFFIKVKDNGAGIPEENIPYVFDSYYQAGTDHDADQAGTGLGLTITRELVYLLGGKIQVESKVGEGSRFTVRLPVTKYASKINTEDFIFKEGDGSETKSFQSPGTFPDTWMDTEKRFPLLLLVEDNRDMISYVSSILESEYSIIVASDGQDGLDRATETIPDIIITDLMMPVMDGYALVKQLKSDFRTSHIPIIILTAKADLPSKLAGLDLGADAYLSKPFAEEELKMRVQKLINLRKSLQERYSMPGYEMLAKLKSGNNEDSFMRKVFDTIGANLHNESFGIAEICLSVGMSRAQLYRKFQALADKSVYDCIRTMRLQNAKKLLEETESNVSDAAFASGFRNLSHFSKLFTETYGINPRACKK